MSRALSGVDADREAIIAELEALVAALKDRDAYIQGIEHTHSTGIDDTSTETVTLNYAVTDEFEGIEPAQYDLRDGGDS